MPSDETALQMLTAALHSISDNVFVKNRELRIVFANEACARFVGLSVEQMIGRRADELFDSPQSSVFLELDRQVLATGRVQTYEEHVVSNTATRWFSTVRAPLRNHKGEIIGVIGVARDVTERHEAEALRRELLEQVLRAETEER